MENREIDSDFLARISHELRTPLTVIKESISLLLEGLGGPLTPMQLKLLQISQKNIERLCHQVDSLLDLKKKEKGLVNKES